jgi:hypothetical protein
LGHTFIFWRYGRVGQPANAPARAKKWNPADVLNCCGDRLRSQLSKRGKGAGGVTDIIERPG